MFGQVRQEASDAEDVVPWAGRGAGHLGLEGGSAAWWPGGGSEALLEWAQVSVLGPLSQPAGSQWRELVLPNDLEILEDASGAAT